MRSTLIILFTGVLLSGCFAKSIKKFQQQSQLKFTDQHFKTAIALIELHKVRNGEYPPVLDSLKYIGDWDAMIFASVDYEKLDSGYRLDAKLRNPKKLNYPLDFWEGTGVVRSNVK